MFLDGVIGWWQGRRKKSSQGLSEDQRKAQEQIIEWWSAKSRPTLTMGGFAGTGKTTIIGHTVRLLRKRPRIAFCCFTGKAADVLRGKLGKAGAIANEDYTGTIHGLIYQPVKTKDADGIEVTRWEKRLHLLFDLIIVDEASMVSGAIWEHLTSYGIPILAVGDHGQLPPVGDRFNLMEKPDIRLERIHRQAADSPIIRLSMLARETGRIPIGEYGPGVIKTTDIEQAWRLGDLGKVMFLCGKNSTRVQFNHEIRRRIGIASSDPVVGDRVICLKNNRAEMIFNGLLGKLIRTTQSMSSSSPPTSTWIPACASAANCGATSSEGKRRSRTTSPGICSIGATP